MFSMNSTSPCQIQGTLKLKGNPFYSGIGHYRDENDVLWDIRMVVGGDNPYVCARRAEGSYYGTGMDDNCYGSHYWPPYKVKLIE